MAAPRKRPLVSRRRRVDDEGEDEGSAATELVDDSQSEISVPSDIDEDADADDSDLSDLDISPSVSTGKPKSKVNGATKSVKPPPSMIMTDALSPPIARSDTNFTAMTDTEVMMNGLKISKGAAQDEGIDFETAGKNGLLSAGDMSQIDTSTSASRQEKERFRSGLYTKSWGVFHARPAVCCWPERFQTIWQRTGQGQRGGWWTILSSKVSLYKDSSIISIQ